MSLPPKTSPEALALAEEVAAACNASPCTWETKIATLAYVMLKVLVLQEEREDRADMGIWLIDRLSHAVATGKVTQ